jgi:16S rRNA (guanine966-N2)-methyltransferase
MTRIIAGKARGRPLAVPKSGTRPTSDRAREGLFSTLGSLLDLEGIAFLDLYAGSGAVGIEALSRGAATATLVESNPQAAQVIRANLASAGLSGGNVDTRTVSTFLARPAPRAYDVVFLDAPYERDVVEDTVLLLEHGWVGADTVSCVERASRSGPYPWPEGWEPIRERVYGEATIWYGRPSQVR